MLENHNQRVRDKRVLQKSLGPLRAQEVEQVHHLVIDHKDQAHHLAEILADQMTITLKDAHHRLATVHKEAVHHSVTSQDQAHHLEAVHKDQAHHLVTSQDHRLVVILASQMTIGMPQDLLQTEGRAMILADLLVLNLGVDLVLRQKVILVAIEALQKENKLLKSLNY